jgi:hypothetical protein
MTKDKYKSILDEFGVERPLCKCCGEEIYYDDTVVTVPDGCNLKFWGKNYKTTKTVNGNTYYLKVCQDCLLKKYP